MICHVNNLVPKIYIIDHSLQEEGGHHYEYVMLVSQAAQQRGFETVLAVNQRFNPHNTSLNCAAILPLFRYSTYSKFSVAVKLKYNHPPQPVNPYRNDLSRNHVGSTLSLKSLLSPRTWWSQLKTYKQERRLNLKQRHRVELFVDGCRRLFETYPVSPGDHVFVPTLSEFDLVGFVRFIESCRDAKLAIWHFQFHFGFLRGRGPEYINQLDQLAAMRDHFGPLMKSLASVPSHFYATTSAMVHQYNLMQSPKFHLLPYPVNPTIQPSALSLNPPPFRVVCPGGLRAEKGVQQLGQVLEDLTQDDFFNGNLQFWVQASKASEIPCFGKSPSLSVESPSESVLSHVRLVHVPYPLNSGDYLDFLHQADIGLLMYDSRRYYARCSGVLLELMAAGIPLIVPAGCWMADEVSEPNSVYLEELAGTHQILKETYLLGPNSKVVVGAADNPTTFSLNEWPACSEMIVDFRWELETEFGTYLRLKLDQFDFSGNAIASSQSVIGMRKGNQPSLALFHLDPSAHSLKLEFSNAYQDHLFTIHDIRLRFFKSADDQQHCPIGKVGLIATAPSDVPKLLLEFLNHADHYIQSARAHAQEYSESHSPNRVLSSLLEIAVDKK